VTCKITIVTNYVFPPIPTRQFDWSARFDNYEAGDPIGYGYTEVDAIRDLIDIWDDLREEDAMKGSEDEPA